MHFMVASGIDGFGLDIEGDIYTLVSQNASARVALTTTLVRLKARMEHFVPGSLLAVWIQGGHPWTPDFSPEQIQATFVKWKTSFKRFVICCSSNTGSRRWPSKS